MHAKDHLARLLIVSVFLWGWIAAIPTELASAMMKKKSLNRRKHGVAEKMGPEGCTCTKGWSCKSLKWECVGYKVDCNKSDLCIHRRSIERQDDSCLNVQKHRVAEPYFIGQILNSYKIL